MKAQPFKTPSRFMAAWITLLLLGCFGTVTLYPIFGKADFDAGLVQTLQNLVILAVGYYLGSSQGAKDNADTVRAVATQQQMPSSGTGGNPVQVSVVNDDKDPVPVTDSKG